MLCDRYINMYILLYLHRTKMKRAIYCGGGIYNTHKNLCVFFAFIYKIYNKKEKNKFSASKICAITIEKVKFEQIYYKKCSLFW